MTRSRRVLLVTLAVALQACGTAHAPLFSLGHGLDTVCASPMQELACPRQDFDGDGLRNAVDRCPEEAARTSDGCPRSR